MPRDTVYYCDWTARNGWNYRFEFLPAGIYDSANGITLPANHNAPAFGADPGVGSIYHRLGDTILLNGAVGDTKYESGLPLGWPETPILDMTFNLQRLFDQGEEDFVAYLLNPVQASGGQIYDGASYRGIDTYNWVRILSDRGQGGMPYYTEFEGCQQPQPVSELTVAKKTRTAELSVTFRDVVRVCAEAVTTDILTDYWLRTYFEYDEFGGYQKPGNADHSARAVYDYLYEADFDGVTYPHARVRAMYGSIVSVIEDSVWTGFENVYAKMRFFPYSTITAAIANLMWWAYRSMRRWHNSNASSLKVYMTSQGSADDYTQATPLDHLHFYEQDHTQENSVGTSRRFNVLNPGDTRPGNDIWFLGAWWHSYLSGTDIVVDRFTGADLTFTSPDGVPVNAATNYDGQLEAGGFFHPDDELGLSRSWANAWDFLKAWSDGAGCKVQFQHQLGAPYQGMRIHFSPPLASIESDTASRRLIPGRNLLKGGERGAPDGKLAIGGGAIAAVTTATPDVGGEDAEDTDYRRFGISSEKDLGVSLVFHNRPQIGDGADRYAQMAEDDEAPEFNPDLSDPMVAVASSSLPVRGIYYPRPGGTFTGNEIMVRVADGVAVDLSDSVFHAVDGERLPGAKAAPYDSANFASEIDANWWRDMTDAMRTAQANACLPRALAEALSNLFSSPLQTEYRDLRVTLEVASISTLGEEYRITDADGNELGASAFLGSGSFLDTLPARLYLTSVRPDFITGEAECIFLAPVLPS